MVRAGGGGESEMGEHTRAHAKGGEWKKKRREQAHTARRRTPGRIAASARVHCKEKEKSKQGQGSCGRGPNMYEPCPCRHTNR